MSPRLRAALGSIAFLVVAPGVMAGLIPYWLTGWDAAGAVPAWQAAAGWALVAGGTAALRSACARYDV